MEDLSLRTFHHMQNGCGALCVLIDAGGQVDLRRIRIALERLFQAQDGVGRRHFNSVEHDFVLLADTIVDWVAIQRANFTTRLAFSGKHAGFALRR